MNTIDAIMMIRRDGCYWYEPHWFEKSAIDEPLQPYRVVDIQDGTREIAPMICHVMPNRPIPYIDDRTADQEAANAQLAMDRPISQEDGE